MKRKFIFVSVLAAVIAMFTFIACGGTPPELEEPAPVPAPAPLPEPEPEPDPEPAPREPVAPQLAVVLSPALFSPDDDGVDDVLTVTISCIDETPIQGWHIEIREPEPPYHIFSQWEGDGAPPAQITWDGHSASGELVQSASEYPFTLTVTNTAGKTTTATGSIEVDVLVIRDGDILRVQVPSIVFGSNSGGFTGLDEVVLRHNDYILRRIAQVLNKFDAYKVSVEGHANLTAATASARQREDEQELRPLSLRRAQFVLDYLVNLGVDRSRLTAVGVGGARPVASYEDRDNWWKNRRVEFILIK